MSCSQLKYGLEPRFIGFSWLLAFLAVLAVITLCLLGTVVFRTTRQAISTERVEWITNVYPDPPCETCGLPMDGSPTGCQCDGVSALSLLTD